MKSVPISLPPLRATGVSTRAQIALAACACAGVSTFLYAVDPHQHSVYPQCMLYRATGVYCAGCGFTRAIHALLHGRVLEALHDNLLFITALPVVAYLIGSYVVTAWRNNAWPKQDVDEWIVWRWGVGTFVALLLFMVLRNLPGWPFELLRPL